MAFKSKKIPPVKKIRPLNALPRIPSKSLIRKEHAQLGPVTPPPALACMFMRPSYLESSTNAWVAHMPFAFWIIEAMRPSVFVELGTHYGNSYFAFCQGVEKIAMNTCCYAVDTWKGDEHAGAYGEEVFNKVTQHNQGHYAGFSTLIRSSFDEAVHHFEDGSIDLLHIDGLHTYDAVRHDFETWVPKLSDRAIVLFHDTNVKHGNFGVGKYFHELAREYPSFEFHHSYGLGVLGVGSQQCDSLSQFFATRNNPFTAKSFHNIFSRLGQSCLDILDAQKNHVRINEQQRTLEAQRKESEATISQAARMRGVLAERVTALEQAKQVTEEGLAEKATQVKGLNEELEIRRREAEQLQSALEEEKARGALYAGQQDQMNERISILNAALNAEKERNSQEKESSESELARTLAGHCEEVLKLQGEIEQSKREIAQGLADKASTVEGLNEELEIWKREAEQLQRVLEEERIKAMQDATKRDHLCNRIAVLEQEKREYLVRESGNVSTLQEKIKRIEELEWYLGEHKEEVSILKSSLEMSQQQNVAEAKKRELLEDRISKLEVEKCALQEVNQDERSRAPELLRTIESNEREIQELHRVLAQERQLTVEEQNNAKKLQDEMLETKNSLSESNETRDRCSQELKITESKLNNYIQESAIMAKLVSDHSETIRKLKAAEQEVNSREELTNRKLQESTQKNNELAERIRVVTDEKGKVEQAFQEEKSKVSALTAELTRQSEEVKQLRISIEFLHNKATVELKNRNEEKGILRANILSFQKEIRILQLKNKKLLERTPITILKNLSKIEKKKQILRESGWFDEEWYLEQYLDVAESGLDPVTHYINRGADEKRNPSPFFNTEYYLENNPDILDLKMNPLHHFIKIGIHKGLKASP